MAIFLEHFAGSSVAAPIIFLVLFLAIGGGALYLTPRIARWVDQRREKRPGFYDGMLTEDPNARQDAPADGEQDGE